MVTVKLSGTADLRDAEHAYHQLVIPARKHSFFLCIEVRMKRSSKNFTHQVPYHSPASSGVNCKLIIRRFELDEGRINQYVFQDENLGSKHCNNYRSHSEKNGPRSERKHHMRSAIPRSSAFLHTPSTFDHGVAIGRWNQHEFTLRE